MASWLTHFAFNVCWIQRQVSGATEGKDDSPGKYRLVNLTSGIWKQAQKSISKELKANMQLSPSKIDLVIQPGLVSLIIKTHHLAWHFTVYTVFTDNYLQYKINDAHVA